MKRIHEHDRPLTNRECARLYFLLFKMTSHLSPSKLETDTQKARREQAARLWALQILEFAEDLWAQ